MQTLANAWVEAWNSHSLEDILSHYDDDVIFYSPIIQRLNNDPNGFVRGKAALEAYFAKGLAAYPDLHFELYHVLEGINSVVLYYKSVNNRLAAEMMVLNDEGKITEVRAHYKEQ